VFTDNETNKNMTEQTKQIESSNERWDEQIKKDFLDGKFDLLTKKAREEIEAKMKRNRGIK
jgi:hypothetical protein